jgi:thymidylate kinase
MQARYAEPNLVWSFFQELERSDIPYSIVGNYLRIHEEVTSDIDFIVSQSDIKKVALVLWRFAGTAAFKMVQALQHEVEAFYFVLVRVEANGIIYFHPDVCTDYIRHQRIWFSADEILASRRLWNGFFVPSPALSFGYYLAKRIDKGDVGRKHLEALRQWWLEDDQGCDAIIRKMLPATADKLLGVIQAPDTSVLPEALLGDIRSDLLRTKPQVSTMKLRGRELFRKVHRLLRPTGLSIAFLGPDGSGKSSVIGEVQNTIAPAFRRLDYFHLRPRFLGSAGNSGGDVTDPHGQSPRGAISSLVKLAYFAADYWLGYFFKVRPLLVRSSLVIFDRYIYDLYVDPRRFRYGGPKWILRLFTGMMPRPGMTILLDAPTPILQARKAEVSFEETERQRGLYVKLGKIAGAGTSIVDASQPLSDVVADCDRLILDHLQSRFRSKRGL